VVDPEPISISQSNISQSEQSILFGDSESQQFDAHCSEGEGSNVQLSVCIVNWNTRTLLLDALASIYYAPPAFAFEVIVVDNASKDGSAQAVTEQFPQVRLLVNSDNKGYAEGNNQAMERAQGAYILLLNPDVILPPHGLEKAVAFMEQHKKAGALGVRQVYPNGKVQRSVRGFPSPLAVLWELVGLSRLLTNSLYFGAYRMTFFDYAHVAEVDQPMGTFLLMRRETMEEVGLLDLAFPIFFNEVDWCLRCKRAGWKIYFTPDVEIIHFGGASTSQVGAAMAWESRRGLLRFYDKHYRSPWFWPFRGLIALISWPHAWMQARKRTNPN
jgi:GT2 family glycosyltransferase